MTQVNNLPQRLYLALAAFFGDSVLGSYSA